MTTNDESALFSGHFKGRCVTVMGGAKGIGRSIAQQFASAGATVLITDISESVHRTAADLRERGLDVDSRTADATDTGQVEQVFTDISECWGRLDILVNNAGIITIKRTEDTTPEEFSRVLEVNTVAQFTAIKAALPLLEAAGGGSILNAASGQARQGFVFTPSYAASKFGVVGLTQSLAKEYAGRKIRVNAYCPGIAETDMWEYNDREWGRLIGGYAPGEYVQEAISSIPLGRAATGTDIANTLMFLASDAGNYITGQAINIDGGMFMN